MGYAKSTIKGISWVGALRLSSRVIALLRIVLLARILEPLQFGAYGIALIIVSFLEVLTETGVNVILIQEKEGIGKYINSAWAVSIIRGIIISITIFLSASFIAQFFHSEDVLPLLQLISLVPLIRGFINPAVVKFQKEIQFDREFWYRLVIFLTDAAVTIILAFITKHAIALVFGLITGSLLELFFSFIIVKPTPKFDSFNKKYIAKILHRGKWITTSGIFNYLFRNVDSIVVGKYLGSVHLGLYQMGYSFSTLPVTELSDVFARVTFPIFTKISDESLRLKKAFLKSVLVLSFLAIPFGTILFLFPEQIVKVLLGEKWIGIIDLLRILAIFGVIRAISGFSSALFLASGKQEYISVVTLVSILGLSIFVVPLVLNFGIVGAGISVLIGSLAALPFMIYYTLKILNKH